MKPLSTMRQFACGVAALLLLSLSGAVLAQDNAVRGPDKVVYHFDGGLAQATKGLRNHLDIDPKAKIVAVAHAEGVDFLMEGAKSTNGQAFESIVQDLAGRGVVFEVCEITMRGRGLKREQFIMGAGFTPSGVVRLANLQAREGYAYIKP